MSDDEKNLNLLAVFHYIIGGMTGFIFLFPLLHVFAGIAIVTNSYDQSDVLVPYVFGWVLIIIGMSFCLLGWSLAIALLTAADRLRQRKSHRFCFVVACVECIMMPLGTVLGVFTILLLSKDSVKALFDTDAKTEKTTEFTG